MKEKTMQTSTTEHWLMLLSDMLSEGCALDTALSQLEAIMDEKSFEQLRNVIHQKTIDTGAAHRGKFSLVTTSAENAALFQAQLLRVRNRQRLWRQLNTTASAYINPQLTYLAALSVVFSLISWTWLSFVADSFTAFFDNESRSALTGFASIIDWAAENPNLMSLGISLIFFFGLCMAYLTFMNKREAKKLIQHGKTNRIFGWLYPQVIELHNLLFHPFNSTQIAASTLLNKDEKNELTTAHQLHIEQSTLDRMLSEDVTHLSQRLTQRAKRVFTAFTIMLWSLIGLLVLSAYSIIFSMGKAI